MLALLTPTTGDLAERWSRAAAPWPDPVLTDDAAQILAVTADGLRTARAGVASETTQARLAHHQQSTAVLTG